MGDGDIGQADCAVDEPSVVRRLRAYEGRSMDDRVRPTNPNITAREACELASHLALQRLLLQDVREFVRLSMHGTFESRRNVLARIDAATSASVT